MDEQCEEKVTRNELHMMKRLVHSVRVVNEKERERRTPKECGEWSVPCGVSPPHRGSRLCPSPEKFSILALNMVSFGAFWVVFFYSSSTVQLPVLHAKPEFNRYRRIKAVMVSR